MGVGAGSFSTWPTPTNHGVPITDISGGISVAKMSIGSCNQTAERVPIILDNLCFAMVSDCSTSLLLVYTGGFILALGTSFVPLVPRPSQSLFDTIFAAASCLNCVLTSDVSVSVAREHSLQSLSKTSSSLPAIHISAVPGASAYWEFATLFGTCCSSTPSARPSAVGSALPTLTQPLNDSKLDDGGVPDWVLQCLQMRIMATGAAPLSEELHKFLRVGSVFVIRVTYTLSWSSLAMDLPVAAIRKTTNST